MKGLPDDPVHALRARELLAETRQLIAAERWKDAAPRSHALMQIAPDLAEAYDLMGVVAMKTGAPQIAEACFARAIAIGPVSATRLHNLGRALLALGKSGEAERPLQRALNIRADDPAILSDLGDAQLNLGKHADALKSFRRALKKDPKHRYAAHMVAALTETGTPDPTYVRRLFDDYAEIFDEHLTGKLAYRVPDALAAMLAAEGHKARTVLDLGCGTGLVAAALQGRFGAIDGVDIAPKMVEQAQSRRLYRNLTVGDCAEVVASNPDFAGPYDTIIAADVFIYIGALEILFDAMMPRLADNGRIAFSVETSSTSDIEIRSSGRFAHSASYIGTLADKNGLTILAQQDHDIRMELERPIPGQLYLLGRAN